MLVSKVLFISVILSGFSYLYAESPKNVILVIAKGMSSETVTKARIKQANITGSDSSHLLSFEGFPCSSLLKTSKDGLNGSASSSASTLFRGNYSQVNSSCERTDSYEDDTIISVAQKYNKSTGLVTTMRLTAPLPATLYGIGPGSGVSECPNSVHENCTDASHILIHGHISSSMNVIFGNGHGILGFEGNESNINDSLCYRNDGRNLVDEWKSNNPNGTFVGSAMEFRSHNIKRGEKIFGMFSDSDLRNDTEAKILNEVVSKTLDVLKYNENGYFLVVIVDDVNVVETILKVSELVKHLRDNISEETLLITTSDYAHGLAESAKKLDVPFYALRTCKPIFDSIDDQAVLGSRLIGLSMYENNQNNEIIGKFAVIKLDMFQDAIQQGLAELNKMANELYKMFFRED